MSRGRTLLRAYLAGPVLTSLLAGFGALCGGAGAVLALHWLGYL